MIWTLDIPAGNFFGGSDPVAVIIGMVVCALVFLLLILRSKKNAVKAEKEQEQTVASSFEAATPVSTATVALQGPVVSSAQVRNGVDPETTAVISAAVAACMPAGEKYSIKKIDLAEK